MRNYFFWVLLTQARDEVRYGWKLSNSSRDCFLQRDIMYRKFRCCKPRDTFPSSWWNSDNLWAHERSFVMSQTWKNVLQFSWHFSTSIFQAYLQLWSKSGRTRRYVTFWDCTGQDTSSLQFQCWEHTNLNQCRRLQAYQPHSMSATCLFPFLWPIIQINDKKMKFLPLSSWL